MEHFKTVKRIAALFICCVIMVGVFLPFFVYGVSYYPIEHTLSRPYSNSRIVHNTSGTIYFEYIADGTITSYDYNSILYNYGYVSSTGYSYIETIFYTGTSNTGSIILDISVSWSNGNLSYTGRTIKNMNSYNVSRTYSNGYYTPIMSQYYIYASRPIDLNPVSYFQFNNTAGYILTFDSQGGSAIAAESGVTDVILGDSTGYFPQYIPTRSGYEFLGWSLTPGGTYVREVHLDSDITIYANWRINDGWCQVSFPDNSTIQLYLEGMIALPSHIAVRNMSSFSVYYYQPSSLANDSLFFDEWIITEQLNETTVTEVLRASEYDSENDIYKLDLSVTGNDIIVQPKIYTPYTCKLRWDSDIDQYLTVKDDLGVVFHNGDYITYYTYDGLDLTFNVQYPYLYCRMILYQDIAGAPFVISDEYLNYYGYYDDTTNNTYNYKVHISAPENCVLLLNADAVDLDYDPNDPVVSFDADGNAHWIVSAEDSFMDVDWDSVYSIIPSDFNGIMGTIFNLKGLAIIGSICFTAAFAIWFVRRGG